MRPREAKPFTRCRRRGERSFGSNWPSKRINEGALAVGLKNKGKEFVEKGTEIYYRKIDILRDKH